MTDRSEYIYYMNYALSLAGRHKGQTGSNPSVGCVIVKDGHVIATGTTGQGGKPHAEVCALEMAREEAKGATAFVTLEPCSHYGSTPPCALALIESGIREVVIAIGDPNPLVNGQGIKMLREAGIEVVTGICEKQAQLCHADFLHYITQKMPFVTLKIAQSLDGKIALSNHKSQWITGEEARYYGHFLRARHQAIVVGIGTVLADDPVLSCRLNGLSYASPIRIILDRMLRLPLTSRLVQTAGEIPVWVVTESKNPDDYTRLQDHNVNIISVEDIYNLKVVLSTLAEYKIQSLLIEGGSTVITNFIRQSLYQHMAVFTAGKLIGCDGLSAVLDLHLQEVEQCPQYRLLEKQNFLNNDCYNLWQRI